MSAPTMRRVDRIMPDEQTGQVLERGMVGRLATVDADGHPYCVPLLYIWADDQIFVHGAAARSYWQANVAREPRVCFAIDEPGAVFDYGRFECDTGLAFRSVILFGTLRATEDRATKQLFYERLMQKYGKPDTMRPKSYFPRLDATTVYALTVERKSGKECALPEVAEQWPAMDRTKTPEALPAPP